MSLARRSDPTFPLSLSGTPSAPLPRSASGHVDTKQRLKKRTLSLIYSRFGRARGQWTRGIRLRALHETHTKIAGGAINAIH